MDDAAIRERCKALDEQWLSSDDLGPATNPLEFVYRAAYADGQRDGMERAAGICEVNASADGELLARTIHQAAGEVGVGEIKVGDKVETCVYVCNERIPVRTGYVVGMSPDGSICDVDIASHCGCAPWIVKEATTHLLKVHP